MSTWLLLQVHWWTPLNGGGAAPSPAFESGKEQNLSSATNMEVCKHFAWIRFVDCSWKEQDVSCWLFLRMDTHPRQQQQQQVFLLLQPHVVATNRRGKMPEQEVAMPSFDSVKWLVVSSAISARVPACRWSANESWTRTNRIKLRIKIETNSTQTFRNNLAIVCVFIQGNMWLSFSSQWKHFT